MYTDAHPFADAGSKMLTNGSPSNLLSTESTCGNFSGMKTSQIRFCEARLMSKPVRLFASASTPNAASSNHGLSFLRRTTSGSNEKTRLLRSFLRPEKARATRAYPCQARARVTSPESASKKPCGKPSKRHAKRHSTPTENHRIA